VVSAVPSVITGGITTGTDPLYQDLIVSADSKFWCCVESSEPPRLFGIIIARTQPAHLEHDKAKAELKTLLPDGAQQAIGHGLRASAAAKC
jgi:hypothetical protein